MAPAPTRGSFRFDIVLRQAGVDPHADERLRRLGRLALSDEGPRCARFTLA